jgi:hypothetical protein
MVCYSRITATAMTDVDQIAKAITALGYTIQRQDANNVHATTHTGGFKILDFKRGADGKFVGTWGAENEIQKVGKMYAGMTVQKFAQKRGFSVLGQSKTNADQYVLVRR